MHLFLAILAIYVDTLAFLVTGDIATFSTLLSNSLMIILVSDIGLNWSHEVNVDSLGTDNTFACFHISGKLLDSSEVLNIFVI